MATNNNLSLISLGCAKNLVNSEQMMALLKEKGYDIKILSSTAAAAGSIAVIVNTCGFIDSAKSEAIDIILELGQMKEDGEIGKILVAGCLAERYKDQIADELPEVDAFIGVGGYGSIPEAVKALIDNKSYRSFPDPEDFDDNTSRILTTPSSWAYLKIAEGCDNFCAFCAIPSIRGRYRSRPMEDLEEETRILAKAGVRELIVIAQDITRYGTDIYGEKRLTELLRRISKVEGIEWIRLHYLYPDSINEELVEEIAENRKILKYLDIPIQHIDNEILKNMGRRGTGDDIRRLIPMLRQRIPGLVIRTSIIAGLPGEGEEEFESLCEFLKEAKFERGGVFPYSPEEGTPAAKMDRPDRETAFRRTEMIEDIFSRIIDKFNEDRVGKVVPVLIEGFLNGRIYGRSYAESPDIDGGVIIEVDKDTEITIGDFVDVLITGADGGDAVGIIRGGGEL